VPKFLCFTSKGARHFQLSEVSLEAQAAKLEQLWLTPAFFFLNLISFQLKVLSMVGNTCFVHRTTDGRVIAYLLPEDWSISVMISWSKESPWLKLSLRPNPGGCNSEGGFLDEKVKVHSLYRAGLKDPHPKELAEFFTKLTVLPSCLNSLSTVGKLH